MTTAPVPFEPHESGAFLHGTKDKRFPGNPTMSYRTREPVRVVGELENWIGHAPEQIRAMREGLTKLQRDGEAVILD